MSGGIVVSGNDWSVLVPDDEATWEPRSTVSICVPTRNPGHGLTRTLKCLTEQTYPMDLIEVVIADDGSDSEIVLPDGLGYEARVVRQERTLDFGAGQARNLAASVASGEILFFLDADVVPERQVVESYARWFQQCSLAVPMGICRFVDVDGLSDEALADLVRSGTMATHFASADVDQQDWRELHFARTNDLRQEAIDAFRVTIGATLAVSADQFRAVGGFPELGIRGVEDTAFGHRVHNNGGVLILDRDAQHWHQGRRNLSDPAVRERINEVRAPYVESIMPIKGFRRGEPPSDPPVEVVPVARVRIHGDVAGSAATRRSIEECHTRNVVIDDGSVRETSDGAFVQIDVPAGVMWSSNTVERIVALLGEHQVGVIKGLVEGSSDGEVVTIVRTRALRRAQQLRPDDEMTATVIELFGVWWVDCASLGLISPYPNQSGEPANSEHVTWMSRLYDGVVDLLRKAVK